MKTEYQFAEIFTSIEMLYQRIIWFAILTDTISFAFWIIWQWCHVMVKVFLIFCVKNITFVPPWFQSMIEITRTSVSILTLVQSSMTINFASGQVDFQFTCPKGQMKILEKNKLLLWCVYVIWASQILACSSGRAS